MIFSVSNDGIEWCLDFRAVTVTLNRKDLVQELTIKIHDMTPPASILLMLQKQDFSNDHLAQVPITQNQQGTLKMRDELLPNVGAQERAQAGMRYPIWRCLSFNGRILTSTWIESFDQSETILFVFLFSTILRCVHWLKTRF